MIDPPLPTFTLIGPPKKARGYLQETSYISLAIEKQFQKCTAERSHGREYNTLSVNISEMEIEGGIKTGWNK
ncbi:MAG TPA: hypothetical protein DDY17_03010 [Syntrophaceae bacterium]|jgi:hypothetical protein|nr:hypothetical protein [Syntrophaceae bacterium]